MIARLLPEGNSVYSDFTLFKSIFPPISYTVIRCVWVSKGLSGKRTVHEGNVGGMRMLWRFHLMNHNSDLVLHCGYQGNEIIAYYKIR